MAAPPSTLPSTLALAIGFTFVGAITGFFLGQASSIGVFGGSSGSIQPQRRRVAKHSGTVGSKNRHDADESDEEESGSEDEQEGLQGFEKHGGECKLTLVVRSDLGMGKGKIAAQCSHATLACYRTLQSSSAGQSILRRWERLGQAKVALKCDSQQELEILQARAISLGICAKIIQDAGRTQIEAGSSTVLGVGPAPKQMVDQVTGNLKLL